MFLLLCRNTNYFITHSKSRRDQRKTDLQPHPFYAYEKRLPKAVTSFADIETEFMLLL